MHKEAPCNPKTTPHLTIPTRPHVHACAITPRQAGSLQHHHAQQMEPGRSLLWSTSALSQKVVGQGAGGREGRDPSTIAKAPLQPHAATCPRLGHCAAPGMQPVASYQGEQQHQRSLFFAAAFGERLIVFSQIKAEPNCTEELLRHSRKVASSIHGVKHASSALLHES